MSKTLWKGGVGVFCSHSQLSEWKKLYFIFIRTKATTFANKQNSITSANKQNSIISANKQTQSFQQISKTQWIQQISKTQTLQWIRKKSITLDCNDFFFIYINKSTILSFFEKEFNSLMILITHVLISITLQSNYKNYLFYTYTYLSTLTNFCPTWWDSRICWLYPAER